jgi:iron complex outermembrane receptor protein
MKRTHLSLAIGLLLGLGASANSYAEDAPAAPSEGEQEATRLDGVVVSARRREETLQEVPVAVSAFSDADLVELQASNIDSLQGAVPNMNIVQARGSSSAVNVFIRGIGQPDSLQTFDPGVGMYVDDVYYSRIQGALFKLFDVDHVEVLRGPQGTLYGKNSTGGAIKIVTKEPGNETTGSVELTAGSFGLLEGKAYVSTPLNDHWGISAAIVDSSNDGYVKDPVTRKRYNGEDTEAIRLKLSGTPSDTFKAVFSLDYTHQDNALTLGNPEAPLIRTDLALGAVVLRPPSASEYDYRTRTSFDPDQGQKLIHKGASAALTWNPSDAWMIKSITAYRSLETKAFIDIDASEYVLGDVYVGLDQNQFSQELQAQYSNGSNLNATYGLYFMREHVPSTQFAWADDFYGFGGAPISFLRTIGDDLTTRSAAAYAQMNWEFSPSWTLGAGIRYTRETKDYDRTTSTFWGPLLASLDGTVAFDAKKTWNAVTPSLTLQKAFNEQVMGYVSANRGFKSGGFNGRANAAAEAAAPEFDPEFVWTYEMGLKMTSSDGRLIGNITAFHSNYDDFQARVSGEEAGSFPVLNAAQLKIDGIELEGTALVGNGTRLSAQIGWMNARYGEFIDPRVDTSPELAGLHDHVPFSPKVTARVAASHIFSLGDAGSLTLGGDVSYRDKSWLSVDNRDVLTQDAFTTAGLFGIWDSIDYKWQVRAGVRNLTDKLYKTDAQEFSSVGNIQTAYYAMPRNYYFTVRYNF